MPDLVRIYLLAKLKKCNFFAIFFAQSEKSCTFAAKTNKIFIVKV